MKFILERTREGQEELEYLEKAISCLLNDRRRASGSKQITIETAIKNLVTEAQSVAQTLLNYYGDADGLRKKEIKFIADPDTLWNNYYSTLKGIKDYYRHNEHYNAPIEARNLKAMVKKACADVHLDSIFKPEENSGKCIYLQDFYIQFVNLQPLRNYRLNMHRQQEVHRLRNKGLTDDKLLESHVAPFVEMDYVTFLSSFHQFHLIPRYCKYRNVDYVKYLKDLHAYLADFFCRQNPLANSQSLEASMEESFKTAWDANSLQYWKDKTYTLELYNAPSDKLFSSKGILESFTKGKRYAAMKAKWDEHNDVHNDHSIETHSGHHNEHNGHCDGREHSSSHGSDHSSSLLTHHSEPIPWYAKSVEHDREIARLEYIVCAYKETLQTTVDASIENVEKRESRTHKELNSLTEEILKAVEETPDVDLEESDPSEDEEKVVYNPLNLPLGWDGKPIPYWLYKLHGLGQEFKCEICGNYSYWGRKAFENHFQEWRHSFGMRCLKIPNTPHFKEITKIEDAFALYEKLKTMSDRNTFKVAQEAECEDSEGNLMSVKAYEDLKRQGLL